MAIINEWLSIDRTSGTGNAQITLTASSYEELVERTQSLVIQGQRESVYLNVKQNGIVPSITLNTRTLNFEYIGGTKTVTINSNVPWSAIVGEGDWFTVNKTSGEKGVTTISITADRNSLYENKNGIIEFAYEGEVLATLNINLEQKPTPTASLERTNMDFSYTADNDTNTITTNSYWKAVCGGEWFSINPTSGDGTTQFTILVTANDSYDAREGKIYFYSDDDILMATLAVSQEGKVRPTATLDYYSISAFGLGGDFVNGITSNVPWTAVVSGNWFTIDKTSGNEGYTNFNVTINETEVERDGNISFYHNSVLLCTLTITQTNIVPSTNIITYRTSDNSVYPFKLRPSLGKIISNTYENGIGTIIINQPIKQFVWSSEYTLNRDRIIEMTIPEGVEIIGEGIGYYDWAFFNTSVKTITLPSTLKRIGEGAFSSSKLETITLPSSLEYIGASAFSDTNISSITIPYSLSKHFEEYEHESNNGNSAFRNCKNLIEVLFEYGIKHIPTRMFDGCSSLKNVNFPSTLLSIKNGAFFGCGFVSLTLPSSIIKIGSWAFSGNNSLTTVNVLAKYIGDRAFFNCSLLTNISLNAEVIGFQAFNMTGSDYPSITSLSLGNRLEMIGEDAFKNMYGMEEPITLPTTIKYIGSTHLNYSIDANEVSNYTNLEYANKLSLKFDSPTTINLPNSLVYIGYIDYPYSDSITTNTTLNFGNNLKVIGISPDEMKLYFNSEKTEIKQFNGKTDNLLNNNGVYKEIKDAYNDGFSFVVNYTTTDGNKVVLTDNTYVTSHSYGTINFSAPPKYRSNTIIQFDNESSNRLKTISISQVCAPFKPFLRIHPTDYNLNYIKTQSLWSTDWVYMENGTIDLYDNATSLDVSSDGGTITILNGSSLIFAGDVLSTNSSQAPTNLLEGTIYLSDKDAYIHGKYKTSFKKIEHIKNKLIEWDSDIDLSECTFENDDVKNYYLM